jgi:predicted transcriptional regulator
MALNVGFETLADLGKEHAMPILEVLYARGWATSSEVALELSVHISTAQSYLEGLRAKGILQSRYREGRTGLVEYALVDTSVTVKIDLKKILEEKSKAARARADVLFIKEKKGANVSFEWDESRKMILAINFMEKSKKFGRVGIARTMRLTEVEGRFLWLLPQSTEAPKSVAQIANEAGITNPIDFIKVIELVEMLAHEKIIVVNQGGYEK